MGFDRSGIARHFGQRFCLGALLTGYVVTTAAVASPYDPGTTLHPGDRIAISVYNHPELQVLSATVDASGQVSVPVAGMVEAQDLTPQALSERIAGRLSEYVRSPAVDVQLVAEGQNIFVSGGPGGVLAYSPGENLAAALAQLEADPATGLNTANPNDMSVAQAQQIRLASVNLHRVVIWRNGHDLPPVDASGLSVVGDGGPAMHPDDTIKLVTKPVPVYVRGDVRQPTTAYLDTDEPISNALRQAGGANDLTASVGFDLTRDGSTQLVTTSSPAYSQPAQPGDVVDVAHGERIGVIGQVEKSGPVLLQGDRSLLSALYGAGGPTKYGDIRHVSVIHDGVQTVYDVTNLTHGSPSANPQLADGDTVFVPEGHKIDFSLLFQGIIAASTLRFL